MNPRRRLLHRGTALCAPLLLPALASRVAVAQPAAARPAAFAQLGSTRRLEVLPLVDWNVARPDLRGEAGVSYLVRTDRATILFDLGGNLQGSDPSPLLDNMKRLGVSFADIDTLVISHPHMDHVGGQRFATSRTFSPGNEQIDLGRLRVFVPTPMSYPGLQPQVVVGPTVIAPGVASTGPLTGRLYMGPVDEQALAIRVEGQGIALIVGCGHQGLAALLERTAALFDEPLHAMVGGLHYPVPKGRWQSMGVDVQRWAVWGPTGGPTLEDVGREIDLLARTGVRLVSLSPHDSSDEAIEAFRARFGAGYRDLRVGEPLVLGERTS
jgi:7,8-dihydropterin-6-yl-methyl-4-(beta-D-ribofuranosyl)aminobenzene 5'-phosphate synthase